MDYCTQYTTPWGYPNNERTLQVPTISWWRRRSGAPGLVTCTKEGWSRCRRVHRSALQPPPCLAMAGQMGRQTPCGVSVTRALIEMIKRGLSEYKHVRSARLQPEQLPRVADCLQSTAGSSGTPWKSPPMLHINWSSMGVCDNRHIKQLADVDGFLCQIRIPYSARPENALGRLKYIYFVKLTYYLHEISCLCIRGVGALYKGGGWKNRGKFKMGGVPGAVHTEIWN